MIVNQKSIKQLCESWWKKKKKKKCYYSKEDEKVKSPASQLLGGSKLRAIQLTYCVLLECSWCADSGARGAENCVSKRSRRVDELLRMVNISWVDKCLEYLQTFRGGEFLLPRSLKSSFLSSKCGKMVGARVSNYTPNCGDNFFLFFHKLMNVSGSALCAW